MGISLTIIAVMAIEDFNNPLIYTMMVFLAIYQWTLGTYTWVYLGAVASDSALTLASFVAIVPIFPASMFTKMGAPATFFFFGAGTFLFSAFFFCFLKETKGLTRD